MALTFAVAALAALAILAVLALMGGGRGERLHFEREEAELIISNPAGGSLTLFKAGRSLQEANEITSFDGKRIWLARGNYFLKANQPGRSLFYPIPLIGYKGGPDEDGAFVITVRSLPPDAPPRLLADSPEFAYVPSGHFLMGDRLNLQEPHYVWLTGYFISPFEVINAEFKEFINDPVGYADDSNWTEEGRRWKATSISKATALLKPEEAEFNRYGQPDQPVVQVNWFEANAFCKWLTRKVGNDKWLFALPSDAEWEKAARGPDSFDYGLGLAVSDSEVSLYNWKKNPSAAVSVVGLRDTRSAYMPNRYGLYHMSGNVSEWTGSVYRAFNRQRPYVDDDRNHDETPGLRVVRGGSWYSASIAILYIAYRETFQPQVSAPYLGFRVVVRPLP